MVVRAKCDLNIYDCIKNGVINVEKGAPFEDQDLPLSFTELSFFCEHSIPLVFKLSFSDLTYIKEMESKLQKVAVDKQFIRDAVLKYYSTCQTPF